MNQWKAVIYCRCSTEEESQVDALQKQVAEARNCVSENGWILTDSYVESKSGTTSRGRSEYCRLLEDISSKKFDILVIKTQDRLMRNAKDWYLFLDRMLKNEKRLYLYLEHKFFSADDSLLTGIKAILAEEYSRELSKKVQNAHKNRQKNGGRVMLTNQVFGYDKQPDGSVRINEREAEIIRRIFRCSAAGYGSRRIQNILEEQGVKSRRGNSMTAAAVSRMIRNPMYKGVFVMNRRHFDFETKRTCKNPPEDWIYREGIVPAIVDGELWEQANLAMTQRRNHPTAHIPTDSVGAQCQQRRSLLSGKLICGECGKPYYRCCRKNGVRVIAEWKCSSYVMYGRRHPQNESEREGSSSERQSGCDNLYLNEDMLFSLLKQICRQYNPPDEADKMQIIKKTEMLLCRALMKNENGGAAEKLEAEADRYINQKDRLLTKLLDGVISDEDYQRGSRKLEAALSKVREQKERLKKEQSRDAETEGRISEITAWMEQGGLEQAMISNMLRNTEKIMVFGQYLEFELGEETVRAECPFPGGTKPGRMLEQTRVMELMREQPEITAAQIAERMGMSKGAVDRRIVRLRREGYIKFNGAGGHGAWEILKSPDAHLYQNVHPSL